MKILYISQYFPPEMGAPAARAAELSRHWAAAGHDITVLTGFPNHPTGVVPPEYRSKFRRLVGHEQINGVNVVRTWLLPFPNRKAHERMLNYSSFCASAATTGLFLHAAGRCNSHLPAVAGRPFRLVAGSLEARAVCIRSTRPVARVVGRSRYGQNRFTAAPARWRRSPASCIAMRIESSWSRPPLKTIWSSTGACLEKRSP